MRKLTRRSSVIAAGVALTTTVGIAFAAWTSNGSGSGTAASDPRQAVTFSTASSNGTIYPTGPAGHVTLTVANPNHYKVELSGWSMTGAYYSTDTSHTTDVTTTCGLHFSSSATPLIPGDATAAPVDLSGALSMDNTSDNACANQTFDITLTATATSHV